MLAVSGPLLAIFTYLVLSGGDEEALSAWWFRLLILLDVCYLVAVAALIGLQIARLVVARRAGSAGSKLHGRMVGIFVGVAAGPAILVAIFFFLVIQLGFEAWFSDRVRTVVENSRTIAQAYADEHREAIRGRAVALANELSQAARERPTNVEDYRFRAFLDQLTENSEFSDVYIVNSSGEIEAQGARSYLFTFTKPTVDELTQAQSGSLVINEDRQANELRALIRLDGFFDAYLYVSRPVDGQVLASLEQTNAGVRLYTRLEENRGVWLAQFAALYLGFVLLVLAAAIYLGLWYAERLARPIGRLAAAAQRVRSGDLVVRVKEERGDDEIALLSRVFNRMTAEVKRKQDALTSAKEESEARRSFSEAVLAGVSAGVIGLDANGHLQLFNESAAALLALSPQDDVGRSFVDAAPEFADLLADAQLKPFEAVERPIRLSRHGEERELLARVTARGRSGAALSAAGRRRERALSLSSIDDAESAGGFVVTLDDLTQLVAAQRMAAWGDVARRIAHEIKNPLTPIQLAAERLRRKFSGRLGSDAESFDRYTETIIRQTGDIGRMVDAFVRFAKMPTPKLATQDLTALTREAVLLQSEARSNIRYSITAPDEALPVRADRGQILQALTNLLQNAADAIGARLAEAGAGEPVAPPEIRIRLWAEGEARAVVRIEDNGVGLPPTQRSRLLEPYVTTREKGTGLGLAIVLKILEEHGGALELADAEPFEEGRRPGARAEISLALERDAAASAPTEEVAASA